VDRHEELAVKHERLKALLDDIIEERGDVDTSRIYITGLSMGGYGTWSMISHYPDFFAAAIPICGGGDALRMPKNRPPEKIGIINEFDPEGLKQAVNLPIWTFHGALDEGVPIGETELIVNLLKEAGSEQIQFTVYPEAKHIDAWQKAYTDPEVWKWLFAQSRD